MLDGQLRPGKGHILTLALAPPSPCTALGFGLFTEPLLVASPVENFVRFVGIMSCTGSDEHQS